MRRGLARSARSGQPADLHVGCHRGLGQRQQQPPAHPVILVLEPPQDDHGPSSSSRVRGTARRRRATTSACLAGALGLRGSRCPRARSLWICRRRGQPQQHRRRDCGVEVVARPCLNKCAAADQVDEVALVHNSTGSTATQIFLFMVGEERYAQACALANACDGAPSGRAAAVDGFVVARGSSWREVRRARGSSCRCARDSACSRPACSGFGVLGIRPVRDTTADRLRASLPEPPKNAPTDWRNAVWSVRQLRRLRSLLKS